MAIYIYILYYMYVLLTAYWEIAILGLFFLPDFVRVFGTQVDACVQSLLLGRL